MAMLAEAELNRAVFEDVEMYRGFALRANGAQDFPTSQVPEANPYAASRFALVDAIGMPGVRQFPAGAGSF